MIHKTNLFAWLLVASLTLSCDDDDDDKAMDPDALYKTRRN